jgi:hypothetical protein
MPDYPRPDHHPLCQCRGNPMRAFVCLSGHMLECHYPYSCGVAGCGHLAQYEFGPEEVAVIQRRARERMQAGKLPPYELGQDDQAVVRTG